MTTESKENSFFQSDRFVDLALSSVLIVAATLRVLAFFSIKESIYFNNLLWDEQLYHTWASKIADGSYDPKTIYHFAPLPAYIMAAVYRLASPDIVYIRIINILFGTLLCGIVYLIAKELMDRRLALVAALVAALYKPFIFYSIVPLKTSMAVFSFALAMLLLLKFNASRSPLKLVLLGVSFAILINFRENALLLVPLLFLFICREGYLKKSPHPLIIRNCAFCLVGILIVVSPFLVRNYLISGKVALTSSQAGFNFYIGNNLDNPAPYYRPVPFASSSPFLQESHFTIEANRRTGRAMTPKEASSFWVKEILRQAWEDPASMAGKLTRKTLVFLNRFEAGDHYQIGYMGDFVPFFSLPLPGFALILPFGLAALLIQLRDSRKARWLGFICLVYGATLVIFFTNTRYRLPLLVILIPYAVQGVATLFRQIREGRQKQVVLYLSAVLILSALESLPVRATDDLTAYYNTHAIMLNRTGNEKEAEKFWEASSSLGRPYSAFANSALALMYCNKGDLARASIYLEKIPDDSFNAAAKYKLLGVVRYRERRMRDSVEAFRKSLEINSGGRDTRELLIQVLSSFDPAAAREEEKELKRIKSYFSSL